MKVLMLTIFVTAVTASPLPNSSNAMDMIVNDVPEGSALDVSDIVDIKLNEHANGEVVSVTNLLHPFTAVGIAEAAAAAAAVAPVTNDEVTVVDNEADLPMPIVLPSIIVPEPVGQPSPVATEVVITETVVLPSPATPQVLVPEPVILPSPSVPEVMVPVAVVMPSPAKPEVAVVAEELPVPAPQLSNDLYNDALVQVQYRGPEEPGVFATLQTWFNMVINYFNNNI